MPKLFGWQDRPKEVDRVLGRLPHPVFGVTARPIQGSGAGKVALLYQALAALRPGGFPVHNQVIGDCVSHGWSIAVEVLAAVQILVAKRAEIYPGDISTEDIYAGSRIEIGRGACGTGDGSVGAWAAEYVNRYGTLVRKKYPTVDLSKYSGARAKDWGRPGKGTPDELEPAAREHPVETVSLVTTYEQARDALANGYPIAVCSSQGFHMQRDADGFAKPNPNDPWPHCMAYLAVDDAFKRPGLLQQNSWGPDWIKGPKRHDQPDGSFWTDADVVDRQLKEQDSMAVSGYVGYPAQEIDYTGL